jgi:endonuclease III
MVAKKRAAAAIRLLSREYPKPGISLDYGNPVQLLVSVMLSAQCTDRRVNIVTASLFRKYKTAADFANVKQSVLQREIRSTGFYRNKARHIIAATKIILHDYNGKVPDTMDALLKLPGVARKTANIVLSNAYGKLEGIAVDTHMKRVNFRLGLTRNTNPDRIEQDLMKIIPRKLWNTYTYYIISHGRAVCKAITPACSRCVLRKICPKKGVPRMV